MRSFFKLKFASSGTVTHEESKTFRIYQISCKKFFFMFLTPPLRLYLSLHGGSSYPDTCGVQNICSPFFFGRTISQLHFSRAIAGMCITVYWGWLTFRQHHQWDFGAFWKHSETHRSILMKISKTIHTFPTKATILVMTFYNGIQSLPTWNYQL